MINTITQNDLELHKKWLNNEEGGVRLVCSGDLRGADLRGADLRGANLRYANLSRVDLSEADLRGADIDFSCWPLWCGSKGVITDEKIAAQLAAHGAVVNVRRSDNCTDEEWEAVKNWQSACKKLGGFSHRAFDLGLERSK